VGKVLIAVIGRQGPSDVVLLATKKGLSPVVVQNTRKPSLGGSAEACRSICGTWVTVSRLADQRLNEVLPLEAHVEPVILLDFAPGVPENSFEIVSGDGVRHKSPLQRLMTPTGWIFVRVGQRIGLVPGISPGASSFSGPRVQKE
jgi:hypothetical protein